jgi:hypothetical protein
MRAASADPPPGTKSPNIEGSIKPSGNGASLAGAAAGDGPLNRDVTLSVTSVKKLIGSSDLVEPDARAAFHAM